MLPPMSPKFPLVAAALMALAGCGSAPAATKTDAAAPTTTSAADPNIALIQGRYGDCLKKLHATFDQGGPLLYAYNVSGGRYLVIEARQVNGKTFTVPKDDKDAALLASVGC